ncbi:MAG: NAD-dependent dehydratase [Piscirickettsiaceae bacterium]|nr:MAG: NAD-dependent dehydratase [Piscirickettsiaceae bacterium]
MTTRKITLVTGANGFIGRNLCQTLQEQGVRVRALLRSENEGPWDEVVIADLAVDGLPIEYFHNVETVFHLAGKTHAVNEINTSIDEYYLINVEGTKKLLHTAHQAGVTKFIYCSSVKAIGEGGIIPKKETDPVLPTTYYGQTKLAAEGLVLEFKSISHTAVFRPTMVYGPGNPGNLDRLINAISKKRFPPWPNIKNKRSMVHVDDVVQAALLLASKNQANRQAYNITDGNYYSTFQIIEWIRIELGYSLHKFSTPISLLKMGAKLGDLVSLIIRRKLPLTSDNLEKLIGSAAFDSSKIENELGFRAKWNLKRAFPDIINKSKLEN